MMLTVTAPAQEKILELRAQEDDPDTLGLRIEVTGVQGVEYTYDLTFDPVAEADEAAGDLIEAQGDLPVIIPGASVDSLRGATLDLPTTNGQQGLVLRNPNRPDPLSGMHIELTGSTEDKVVAVDGAAVVRPRMELTLTCDHRAVDGATGADFLRTVKSFLEEPGLAL